MRGFDRNPIVQRICVLENQVARLLGEEPPHKEHCLTCDGTGYVRCFNPRESWDETCTDCGGTG